MRKNKINAQSPIVASIKVRRHVLVQDYTYWYKTTRTGTRLHVLVQDYTCWYKTTRTGTRLHILVQDYTYWYKTTRTGTRLHVLVQDYTYWYKTNTIVLRCGTHVVVHGINACVYGIECTGIYWAFGMQQYY